MADSGPVLRVFEVRAKPGCADALLEKFQTTSAGVVQGEPGNQGYFFGRCIQGGDDQVMFVSVWADLAAVQARFGADWESSYLPPGYEDLIDAHSLRHFDVSEGWQVASET